MVMAAVPLEVIASLPSAAVPIVAARRRVEQVRLVPWLLAVTTASEACGPATDNRQAMAAPVTATAARVG